MKRLLLPVLFFVLACGAKPAALDCSVLPSLPASVEAAEAARAQGSRWTNAQIRARYVCEQQRIGPQNEQWKASGLSVEARAHKAYDVRHNARRIARAMMEDRGSVKMLSSRDQAKYGSPDGPTFEWLMKQLADKGISGDAAYEEIIKSAQRTDEATNRAHLP
jgi:hypothetical protein